MENTNTEPQNKFGNWLKIENSFEISGLHHNAFGGFMGVRIGLCSIGEGEVNYKNFKYSSIPEY